ncbi:lysozyme [Prodigiosinella confusarubida]|uniref:Lysozyme n=1 Tax=Serratia sp. (strain ATCC 39006) TaxID=104623 RepID=A0A2I5T8U5_SERS3|nr:lysozyme [Serratia sp. ATCC 39006]AUH00976.1 lysozyme [Serratia sp. ATCC 39006]AUH05297.1 lysozyme [Serratia sp. ATCC 39006]
MNSTAKRCIAATVLMLAALLPDYSRLHTSRNGLALIANLEGCQLSPYKCSAHVWTNGIGHTAGVSPHHTITEQEAAANLVSDVINVEHALSRCMPVKMPQPIYDAVVSFTFNVGSRAACQSTLAFFINKQRWLDACNQLPRWIYINGVISPGLEQRRKRERTLCLTGVM